MRKLCIFSVVLSLFLPSAASIIWAQTISSQKGLLTATFNTAQGTIKVYLPDDIRPGDIITGTIISEPSGKNARQKEKNWSELARYAIGINGEKFAVNNATLQFFAATDRKMGGQIELLQADGIKAAGLTIPVAKEMKPALTACVLPGHALTGLPLTIPGPFDGDASNTKCNIDNKPVIFLAESPRQFIFSYPRDADELHSLYIQEANRQPCEGYVLGVQLNVYADKLDLLKGERAYITIAITGLQHLPDAATLHLTNATTDVIRMNPSNAIVIRLFPDSVKAGIFYRHFEVQSIKTGSFIVNVDLDLPPVQYEVKKLDKPRRLADEALHTGLSEAIKKLEADAGGAQGKEYNNLCENCQKCIRAMAGKWAEQLVAKLGEELIKESVGKAISMFMESKELLKKLKEMVDKADEAADKAEKLAEELEKKIRAGELQLLVFNDKLCDSNKDCVVSAMIFYDPSTGCVTAFVKCNGRPGLCCPKAFNTAKITYCTDERGMPKGLPHVEVISE